MKYLNILFLSIIFTNNAWANQVVTSESSKTLNYKITTTKLDKSRNDLSAKTGQSAYSFTQQHIDNLPQGQTTSLNQVLLRAPGVTQNAFGQFHIRGDHSNVQYRINDIMIPEGISSFGNSFDMHFVNSLDLLRGALPAQYGFKTAGVVDIKTKGGKFDKNARSEVTVGGNQTMGYNQQLSGFEGKLNYYLNATYLQSSLGIESPSAGKKPIHNDTSQDKLFGYFSYLLDEKKRLSLILSNSTNRFEVPNASGKSPLYTLGSLSIDSRNLNQKQRDENRYAILALQGVTDEELDYQVSLFSSQSQNIFKSDRNGDLIYSGVASNIDRSAFTNGIQGDFSYKIDEKNTLRSGFFASEERAKNNKDSTAFLLEDGHDEEEEGHDHILHASDELTSISDHKKQTTRLYGIYLQDEFKATEKLTLNAGLRFDIFEGNVSENQLSPRFNANYDLTKKTKIFGGYARYFSPARTSNMSNPNIARYVGTTAEPEVTLNNKVRPERSDYYDLGLSHKFNDNLTLTFDSYYKQSRNLLDEHQFGNALIYSPFNYQRGKAYGLEFGADYHKENLSAFVNFSTQKVRAKNIISSQFITHEEDIAAAAGKYIHLDHDQRYSTSFGASYLFKKVTYGIDGFYGSGLRKGEGNAYSMPSYLQTNLSLTRNFDLPFLNKTDFRLAVLNIFDNSYQIRDGSGVGVKASQYGPRRTVYLIVSKSF